MAKLEAWFDVQSEASSTGITVKLTAELAKKGSGVQVSARWDALFYTTPDDSEEYFAGTVIWNSPRRRGTVLFLRSCTTTQETIAEAARKLFKEIPAPEDA